MTNARSLLDRMEDAVARVQARLRRAADALGAAGVAHAVAGDQAVRLWVATAEAAAVRNTPEVVLIIRRGDLSAAAVALGSEGLLHRPAIRPGLFLDGRTAAPRDSVVLLFAGERVREGEAAVEPDVTDWTMLCGFPAVALGPLVRRELAAFGRLSRLRVRDLIDVGLIDATWPARLPAVLGERLQTLLDDPDG